jgi:hypothetical protein
MDHIRTVSVLWKHFINSFTYTPFRKPKLHQEPYSWTWVPSHYFIIRLSCGAVWFVLLKLSSHKPQINTSLDIMKITTFSRYTTLTKGASAGVLHFLPPLKHAASMKLSVSLQFLNLWQSVGFPGRVISSSQDLYLPRTQTWNKRTHTHKHPCLE